MKSFAERRARDAVLQREMSHRRTAFRFRIATCPEPVRGFMATRTMTAGDAALDGSALRDARLAPAAERYPSEAPLSSTHWLTRLELQRPRRDLSCLTPIQRMLKRAVDVAGA